MTARVLIVSYFFPPDGGPGTQRALKFAKYLWRFGWSATVLTRSVPERRGRWDPEDESLLREVPAHVTVERVAAPIKAGSWATSLPVLDNEATHAWSEATFDAAARIVRSGAIDLVFVTMSPFDLAHLGRRLQAQFGVPVVYDLRDPWALDGWRTHRSKAAWEIDAEVMRLTLAQADAVIANTPDARQAMLEAFPDTDPHRLHDIANGYDEGDFDRTPAAGFRRDPDRFRLVHTGSLHTARARRQQGLRGRLWRARRYAPQSIDPSGRTLDHLLEAVARLERQRHPLAGKLRIVLAGQPDEATRRRVERAGMADRIEWLGYLPHVETVRLVQQADALFLPLHDVAPGERSLNVPGKTYEYLAAGRPILACVPPGDARRLVESSPYGLCASPCDPGDIARRLTAMHDAWDAGRLDVAAPPTWITRFERRQLTAQLAECFDRVVGREQPKVLRRAA